ncbi:hypothetical protein TIFTF001_033241 [Ficus carica]|uniref:Uncharacterized protein n=1 Tax=Ficus carica TaxID=3494 RepID=A0AA88J8X9_FICCA|nr:hypothetical protein TIFTF001_033241 [Ficus carica]
MPSQYDPPTTENRYELAIATSDLQASGVGNLVTSPYLNSCNPNNPRWRAPCRHHAFPCSSLEKKVLPCIKSPCDGACLGVGQGGAVGGCCRRRKVVGWSVEGDN